MKQPYADSGTRTNGDRSDQPLWPQWHLQPDRRRRHGRNQTLRKPRDRRRWSDPSRL